MKNRRPLLIILFFCFVAIKGLGQPELQSFIPIQGKAGDMVTVRGSRFSSTPSSLAVYFGGVKAHVFACSSDSIYVQVPAGASYGAITVTDLNTGLTVKSASPFLTIFQGSSSFTEASMASQKEYAASMGINLSAAADFDGDGKPDLASANSWANSISIFHNRSSSDSILFDPRTDLPQGRGGEAAGLTTADFDGDGMIDLAVSLLYENSLVIFKNTSTLGRVSFELAGSFATGDGASTLVAEDFDGDGKTDIALSYSAAPFLSLFRNTSTPGSFSFADRLDLANGMDNASSGICAADLDGDTKMDIALVNWNNSTLSIFKNSSSPGDLQMDAPFEIATQYSPSSIASADLNADGKPELVVVHTGVQSMSIYPNTGSAGTIAFDAPIDFFAGNGIARSVAVMELNGDQMPELAVANENGSEGTATVFAHASDAASLAFASGFDYPVAAGSYHILSADLNSDGRADIVTSSLGNSSLSILRNRSGLFATVKACADTSLQIKSSVTGSRYQWQLNKGTGFVDLFPDAHFQSTTSQTLTLLNAGFDLDGYQLRCRSDDSYSTVYVLDLYTKKHPTVKIEASSAVSCAGFDLTFTSQVSDGGESPSYNWMVNKVPAGVNSPVFVTSSLKDQDQVSLEIRSSIFCSAEALTRSAPLTMNIEQVVQPTGVLNSSFTTCTWQPYKINFSSTNAAQGSQIQLWETFSNGTYSFVSSQAWKGSTLNFSLDGDTIAAQRRFFCAIVPPIAANCYFDGASDTITVTVAQATRPAVEWANSLLSVTNPQSGTVYSWQYQDAAGLWKPVNGAAKGDSYRPEYSGIYRALAQSGSCEMGSSPVSVFFTAIPGVPAAAKGIRTFPNPATDYFIIENLSLSDHWSRVVVVSPDGKKVMELSVEHQTSVTIPMSKLTKGSYVFYLERGNGAPAFGKLLKL